ADQGPVQPADLAGGALEAELELSLSCLAGEIEIGVAHPDGRFLRGSRGRGETECRQCQRERLQPHAILLVTPGCAAASGLLKAAALELNSGSRCRLRGRLAHRRPSLDGRFG